MRTRLLLATLLLAGCTAPTAGPAEPTATDFRPGTCRQIAEPVLGLGRLADRSREARNLDKNDRAELAKRQDELLAAGRAPDADLATKISGLVGAVGFVRLRIDSHSYQPSVLRSMDEARQAVQKACVGS